MRRLTKATPEILNAIVQAAIVADEVGEDFWDGDRDEKECLVVGMRKAGEWATQELLRRTGKG